MKMIYRVIVLVKNVRKNIIMYVCRLDLNTIILMCFIMIFDYMMGNCYGLNDLMKNLWIELKGLLEATQQRDSCSSGLLQEEGECSKRSGGNSVILMKFLKGV